MLTKLLKINSKDYSQIYFTSDSHFGHEPKSWSLAEKRGFKNIQEHDEWQLQFYRNTLPTDLIIHTGDFALNTTPERFIKIVKDTPSKIMMWWGNHESPTSNIYKKCLSNLMVNNYEIYHFIRIRNESCADFFFFFPAFICERLLGDTNYNLVGVGVEDFKNKL